MLLQLTVYLMNGSRDYLEVKREIGDEAEILRELNRSKSLMTEDTWYPLHAIAKIKFGWDYDPEFRAYRQAVEDHARQRRKRRKVVRNLDVEARCPSI